jgi:hypothetical protein
MKFLMTAAVLAALVGAVIVGCGPKQKYCPEITTGQCLPDASVAPPPPEVGGGDAIIINGD